MEQFNIIGALKSYAENLGWIFVFGIDNFERNIQSVVEFSPGQLILMCDFRATPTIRNGQTMAISYTCLMMLGRKIDTDAQRSDLDETNQQKYDRRLKELMQLLNNTIAQVACDNQLDANPNELIVQVNMFAENIDFATGSNVVFTQESFTVTS